MTNAASFQLTGLPALLIILLLLTIFIVGIVTVARKLARTAKNAATHNSDRTPPRT
jgi:F0F1-type ATP synthase assembly protein I